MFSDPQPQTYTNTRSQHPGMRGTCITNYIPPPKTNVALLKMPRGHVIFWKGYMACFTFRFHHSTSESQTYVRTPCVRGKLKRICLDL